MAYVNQERKKSLEPRIKSILKKYGLKGSVSVRNLSTLVLTISKGTIDFIGNIDIPIMHGYMQVNHYIDRDFTGAAREALTELRDAMMIGNHNNSDIQSDYFDVGWYISINIGRWDKPYKLTK